MMDNPNNSILVSSGTINRELHPFTSGYYLAVSDNMRSDSTADRYSSIDRSRFWRWRGYVGCFNVDDDCDKLLLNGCTAEYIGDNAIDILEVIISSDIPKDIWVDDGVNVLSTNICKVKVYFDGKEPVYFTGAGDIRTRRIIKFSVNTMNFVYYELDLYSFIYVSECSLILRDKESGAETELFSDAIQGMCTYADQKLFIRESGDLLVFHGSGYHGTIRGNELYYGLITIPNNIDLKTAQVVRVNIGFNDRYSKRTENDPSVNYVKNQERLQKAVNLYAELGLEIDAEKNLNFIRSFPDLVLLCAEFLEQHYTRMKWFEENRPSLADQRITFEVPIDYKKKYYVAAKLAESARTVQMDEGNKEYLITFSGDQIEEIGLMYFNLVDMGDRYANEHLMDIWEFLGNNHFLSNLEYEIDKWQKRLPGGFNLYHTPAFSIVKARNKSWRNQLDVLYMEMLSEKRAKVKWSSEYLLYTTITAYTDNVVFQYRPVWLVGQSLDIFLPDYKLGIEYQGKQHYEPIKYFGGEKGFEETKRRDTVKAERCLAENVTIAYWKYDIPVEDYRVEKFLINLGVSVHEKKQIRADSMKSKEVFLNTVSVLSDQESKKRRKPIYRQYDLKGKFIAEYDTITAATKATYASAYGIRQVARGKQMYEKGYKWKIIDRETGEEIS